MLQQRNKYIVEELGEKQINILNEEDRNLISSYTITSVPFIESKYAVDLEFYDLQENYIETYRNINSYVLYGNNQKDSITQISVDPVKDAESHNYLGDIEVQYEVFNNLFSPQRTSDIDSLLFVSEISTDRTELRARAINIPNNRIKTYVDSIFNRLNNQAYFSEIYLDFVDEKLKVVGTNIMTEVINNILYITFKLYEPLPANINLRSRFAVIERIGQPVRYKIIREVEIIEKDALQLRGPNFNTNIVESKNIVGNSNYQNYDELLSCPANSAYGELYSLYDEKSAQISIDYSNYSNFIHFSSAAERIQNFAYKLHLLKKYRSEIEINQNNRNTAGVLKYQRLLDGILANFDPYERYLYFESGSNCWPKENNIRPYINIDPDSPSIQGWWESVLAHAQNYDENNPDILVNAIPKAIRESEDNEAYVIFTHMLGQHFDTEWVYAKAVTDKYNADNRLNFGISKDLVKEAIQDFGIDLCETDQNLEDLFKLCNIDGTYNTGSESSVCVFKRIVDNTEATQWQPVLSSSYHREIYKRIYHNLPFLLKTKGTTRGLRALISCFGIPDDILEIKVRGGIKAEKIGFFGPETSTSSSIDRIRIRDTREIPFTFESGSFVTASVLNVDTSIREKDLNEYSDDTHQVEVGFNINKQFNDFAKNKLISASFDYDDLVGDTRNLEENYGISFDNIRNNILSQLRESQVSLRSPSAIIRLVRYIDSTLMRAIKDFVPARVSVVTGVVVEDNLLHRNRYAGIEQAANSIESLTGSIETVFIDGGSGGSLNIVTPRRSVKTIPKEVYGHVVTSIVPTVNYDVKWSTGAQVDVKPVFDDSPKFNGELKDSEYAVTDGEILKFNEHEGTIISGNPYLHAGKENTAYTFNYRFLCLPPTAEDAVCTINLEASKYATRHNIYATSAADNTLTYSYVFTEQGYDAGDAEQPTTAETVVVREGGNAFVIPEPSLPLYGGSANLMMVGELPNGGKPIPIPLVDYTGSILAVSGARAVEIKANDVIEQRFAGWYKNNEYDIQNFLTGGTILTVGIRSLDNNNYVAKYLPNRTMLYRILPHSANLSGNTVTISLKDLKNIGIEEIKCLLSMGTKSIEVTITQEDILQETVSFRILEFTGFGDNLVLPSLRRITINGRTFTEESLLHYIFIGNKVYYTGW